LLQALKKECTDASGTGIPAKSAEERSCLNHKTSGFKLAVLTTEKIEWGRRTTDSLASQQKP